MVIKEKAKALKEKTKAAVQSANQALHEHQGIYGKMAESVDGMAAMLIEYLEKMAKNNSSMFGLPGTVAKVGVAAAFTTLKFVGKAIIHPLDTAKEVQSTVKELGKEAKGTMKEVGAEVKGEMKEMGDTISNKYAAFKENVGQKYDAAATAVNKAKEKVQEGLEVAHDKVNSLKKH